LEKLALAAERAGAETQGGDRKARSAETTIFHDATPIVLPEVRFWNAIDASQPRLFKADCAERLVFAFLGYEKNLTQCKKKRNR
jgi:hypothetical protein